MRPGGKAQRHEQDQEPGRRAELAIERPTDEASHADAGDELGDEAEGLGKRLAAGPPIARFRAARGAL